MEGSFGNQKQHYAVGRIAARNPRGETLLLFIGIHMANAAILAARQLTIEVKEKQRQKRRAKKSCRFSTSEAHRRRIFISVPLRNAVFNTLRTENLPTKSKTHRYTTNTAISRIENSSH